MKIINARQLNVALSICLVLFLGLLWIGSSSEIRLIKQAVAQDNHKDPLTEFRKQNNSEVPYVAPDWDNVKNLRPIDKNTFFSSQKDGTDTIDDDALSAGREKTSSSEPKSAENKSVISEHKAKEPQPLPWSAQKSVVPEDCNLNKSFFFQGIDEIVITFYEESQINSSSKNTEKFFNLIRPIRWEESKGQYIVDRYIREYFSDACLKISYRSQFENQYKYPKSIPNSKIFVDIIATFTGGDVVENYKSAGFIVFNSFIKRPLVSDSKVLREYLSNMLVYNKFMYPRIMVVSEDMTKEAIISKFEKEVLIQLDFHVARTILNNAIWQAEHRDRDIKNQYGEADQYGIPH